jgi:hypothetical protein
VAERLRHAPDLTVTALVEDEFEPGSPEATDLRRCGGPVIELDPPSELLELVVADRPFALDLVHLVDFVPRVCETVRELAVVREQERSRGGSVEPADGDDPSRVLDERDDRRAALWVSRGRYDAGRLVEQHIGE